MSTRFRVDLLHPGMDLRPAGWLAQTWEESFIGSGGERRLAVFTLGCIAVLLVILVAVILPTYWRLSNDLNAVPGLRRDLAARESDLNLLRSNLTGLAEEARRQVRWGELLGSLSQQIPASLRLQVVDAVQVVPGGPAAQPGAAGGQGAPARLENTIRVDAVTPMRPGSPPLLEVAQFMAGLTRDPAVHRRFQLRNWEIKPGAAVGEGIQLLNISFVLAERPQ